MVAIRCITVRRFVRWLVGITREPTVRKTEWRRLGLRDVVIRLNGLSRELRGTRSPRSELLDSLGIEVHRLRSCLADE